MASYQPAKYNNVVNKPDGNLPPRKYRLAIYLLVLSFTMFVPALILGAAVTWRMVGAYRDAFETRLQDTARALALAVDREIGGYRGAMLTLSGSASLDGPEPAIATFEAEARRAAEALGTSLFLVDAGSMRYLVDTSIAPGELSPQISTVDFRPVVETGQPLVTDLVIGAVVRRLVIGVAVPVKRDGRVPFVLVARLAPEKIGALLHEEGPADASFDAVMDSNGAVVARSIEHERYVGRMAPAWLTQGMVGRRTGFLHGTAIEGADVVLGFARVGSTPGWTVVTATPWGTYVASWRQPLEALAVGGSLILILGTLLALLLSRRMVQPLTDLARDAQTFADKTEEAAPLLTALPSRVVEFETLRIGFVAAHATLSKRILAQREAEDRRLLLMREVDHRAKNVLAVALSLVRLAPRDVPPALFASTVERRIAAMARAHSLLAEAAWAGGDLKAVIDGELAPYTERVRLSGPRVLLAAEAVQPTAMLLHELATNAARHGALSVPDGRVSICWNFKAKGGGLNLSWVEAGGPMVTAPSGQRGFGSRLVVRLVERQLGGKIQVDWLTSGLRISIDIPQKRQIIRK